MIGEGRVPIESARVQSACRNNEEVSCTVDHRICVGMALAMFRNEDFYRVLVTEIRHHFFH